MHAYGPIYVLSAEVVASLASSRNNRSVFICGFVCFYNKNLLSSYLVQCGFVCFIQLHIVVTLPTYYGFFFPSRLMVT